jgi:hypothetical protein
MIKNLQIITRYIKPARKYGFYLSLIKGFRKITSFTSLMFREASWTLRSRKLPSDKVILGFTDSEWNSFDQLLSQLCSKESPALLFSNKDKEKYVSILRERYPGKLEGIIKRAKDICANRFQFMGNNLEFTDEINWHLDPQSGHSWPRDYFEKIDRWMWSERRLGDNKLPWELNRHQYYFTLGKAYWLTGDECYADKFSDQVLSWIRQNPLGFGINWYSSLEIGIRLISWIFGFHFFRSSSRFMKRASKLFLKSLYQQVDFLYNHLTLTEEVRNNHIIGEAAALIFVGCLFDEFKDADKWLHTGLQIFEHELIAQTFSDGVNKEQATSYHRFVLDFLLLIIVLTRRGAILPSTQLEEILEKMLNYVMCATMPNGGIPMIGDADDGRGYLFDECAEFWDFRDLLAVGAVLYERPDYKFVAKDFGEEAFWLLGPEGLHAFDEFESKIPQDTSFSFPQAGHYVLREDWIADSDFAFFKCGPFGLGGDGFCAHSHCDLLSFILSIQGIPIIVDSGTYTYHGLLRDQFRITSAHNTVIIDNHEQAKPIRHFGWQTVPQAKCLLWEGNKVVGSMQTTPDVTHKRELGYSKNKVWEINDTFQGKGVHEISWFFHFHPDLLLRWNDESNRIVVESNKYSFVEFLLPIGVQVQLKSGWYSAGYGRKERNPLLIAIWHGKLPADRLNFAWKFQKIGRAIGT